MSKKEIKKDAVIISPASLLPEYVVKNTIQELTNFKKEIDDILWNKVLTIKMSKKVYDEIQEELDKKFQEKINTIKGRK